jgi:acyl carrier protein|tara:strand:- start:80 stop:439 length:360 start_codon:yes stop_codon:yes gene_type:complete
MNGSNRSTVTEAVIKLVTENPMVKIDHIEAPMLLAELNVDSLEKLSIAMDLEEAFDLEITDQEVEDFVTVSDIISCVDQALAAKAAQALADEAEEDINPDSLDVSSNDHQASTQSHHAT